MAVAENGVEYLTLEEELREYFILKREIVCKCCGKLKLAKAIAKLFKGVRDFIGHALTITDGCRCEADQRRLIKSGYSAATNVKTAPHVMGMALDVAVPPGYTTEQFAGIVVRIAKQLFGKACRVGWRIYGGGFVHFDLCWMLSPNPDPVNYQPGVSW